MDQVQHAVDNIVGERIIGALAAHANVNPMKAINWTAEHTGNPDEPVTVTFEMVDEMSLEDFNNIIERAQK